ncbi:c-type cytochrome [Bacteroidota bacterium]
MKSYTYFLGLLLIVTACSGSGSKEKTTTEKIAEPVEQVAKAVETDLTSHPGFPLYKQHCLPCHQADGNGVPGMYPTLHNTEWVNGDVAELINIVVNGMDGEIEVNGEYYNTVMAPLPHLTDNEVADVLTYVRARFGTNASEVTVDDVKAVRNPS